MFGGLNRPTIAAALVVVVALVAPTAALACNGGPSAVNVYKECLPAGGGEKPTSGGQTTTPVSGPVSSRTANALNKAGKDKSRLLSLVKGYGPSRLLQSRSSTAAATDPSALGSAFDLGSGPTTLLALLAGTALLLLATTGLRGLRRRRS